MGSLFGSPRYAWPPDAAGCVLRPSRFRRRRGQACQEMAGRGLEARDVIKRSGDEHRTFQTADDHPSHFVWRSNELKSSFLAALLQNAGQPCLVVVEESDHRVLHRCWEGFVLRGHHAAEAHSLVAQL